MKKLITIVATLLVLAVSGCAPQVDVEADEAAIREAESQWSKAAGAKDLEAVLSFYAEDGASFPPNAPLITSKEVLREDWAQEFADPAYALSWQVTKAEVALAGDLAYAVGSYEFTLSDPEGNPVTDRGKYVTVWKKQADGSWKAVVDIWNSDGPPASE